MSTTVSTPTTDQERKRWEHLRRALLAVVAGQHAADPTAQYTLRINIVPKEAAEHAA